MSDLLRELRFFLGLRSAVLAVVALFILSAIGVGCGLAEISRQQAVIERLPAQQQADVASIAAWVSRDKDAGSAAYYTPHLTWDPPSNLAFAAIGMRDTAPYTLRVRSLGLEAQLYEGDIANPEAMLPGRFDFAFVLIYLAPLFIILLFHDLSSGEREAGRLRALEASANSASTFWRARVAVRYVAIALALVLPFLFGAAVAGATLWKVAAVLLIALLYLAFWMALALLVARPVRGSLANAMSLAAAWLVLTLLAPAVGHAAINAAIPLRQGAELSLKQRDKVHGAWDIPKADTMNAFFKNHPEYAGTKPLGQLDFHYKWYLAFHQVGDESVADLARDYHDGILCRAAWSERLGFLAPGVAAQVAIHRLAETDPAAQIAYLDRIRAFHGQVRRFYYGYLFTDRPFDKADFDRAPAFQPRFANTAPPWISIAALVFLSGITALIAALIQRVRPKRH